METRAADEAMPWYVVEDEPEVCQTPGCLESAETLKAGIDPGEDPCQDFYAYACGGWQKRNPIPATESQWNQFNVVDRKLDFQLRGENLESREPQPSIYFITISILI
jgi:Peptidase family M13